MRAVESYAVGKWIAPGEGARSIESAITGAPIAYAGNDALPFQDMLGWAKTKGGVALGKLTFHDRARMLKALALHLREHRQALYELSYDTGATLSDHKIDIDGGIGTMLVYASKGRREMPDAHVYLDGAPEQLGREGQFFGRHICVPRQGVAVHINAFNFPVWGMLEKLAPTWLAGMPAIVKPATASCYVTEACVRIMLDSGVLPEGALQLVTGGLGDTLDHLGGQDVLSFTGSAETALKLRSHPGILAQAVRFTAEQDSLNASILGPDAVPGTPEFDIFLGEVTRELTAKAGQKCTAIRRILVPQAQVDAVIDQLSGRLAQVKIGDPRDKDTQMGALISSVQKDDVVEKAALIGTEAELVFEGAKTPEAGAFLAPVLFHCANPDTASAVHSVEAFGPISTIMGYRDPSHAAKIANKGEGSLVTSVITHDPDVAREITFASAPYHGRLYFNNRDSAAEATGHGSPLPHMVHGGPGRAGGGEELGGIRGVMHFMQRTAVQGSPDLLSAIGNQWVPGAKQITDKPHPFTCKFHDLELGHTLQTEARTITMGDIEHFAHFTGDTFYAHMDEEAAAANPFFPGRVAHGYLLLSFAAGLFVDPAPGPVLANTGLDNLRFMKPVQAGDSICVELSVKAKTPRNEEYGEIRWNVLLLNQDAEPVASYDLLTMNAY
jgi:oxepin-CoA hydrolase/3-oxo-5,6-dehydrosuberyl-CoA semialdehyde dehydrogenase